MSWGGECDTWRQAGTSWGMSLQSGDTLFSLLPPKLDGFTMLTDIAIEKLVLQDGKLIGGIGRIEKEEF